MMNHDRQKKLSMVEQMDQSFARMTIRQKEVRTAPPVKPQDHENWEPVIAALVQMGLKKGEAIRCASASSGRILEDPGVWVAEALRKRS